jgi:hypothetical protein
MNKLMSIAFAGLMALPATAGEFDQALRFYLSDEIRSWANDPQLVAAINAQNLTTAGLSQGDIDSLDQAWRSEAATNASEVIPPVLNNPLSDFLRQQVASSDGAMTEVIVMDARGLNVAVSEITGDYWQGDEAKYIDTYAVGADAVHIGELEVDGSTGKYQGQISLTIIDPASGQPIGALTVGVIADALM